MSATDRRSATGHAKRVAPLELFFDLVFVFALTQVTALMVADPTARGISRGLLVLAAVWWAWAAYAWLTNEVDPDDAGVRIAIFAAMVAMLVASLAVPKAFGEDALVFALAYLAVRTLHVVAFAQAAGADRVRSAALALAPAAIAAPALLVGAALLAGPRQSAVWPLALALDYVGGGRRGIAGWRLSPTHFAERHGLIVIIVLGESIIALGAGLGGAALGSRDLAAVALGLVLAAALWWSYFDSVAAAVEERLRLAADGRARNTLARDVYSYLHLVLCAGIVLLAFGMKKILVHVDVPLPPAPALAAAGGTGLYLLGLAAVQLRACGVASRARLGAGLACAPVAVLALVLPGLATLAVLAALAAGVVAGEAR